MHVRSTLRACTIAATVLTASLAVADDLPATRPTTAPLILPTRIPVHLADVFRLTVEGGHLVLHTKYETAGGNGRGIASVQIEEFGTCALSIRRNPEGGDTPQQFYLYITTHSPETILIRTHLTSGDPSGPRAGLQLRRLVQTNDGVWTVTLSQGISNMAGFPGDSKWTVVLGVSDSRDPSNNFTRTAPDWKSLRQQFGPEVDYYLRPVFNDLRQHSLFAVEPVVAWQVLSDAWKPDPALQGRINAQLPGLAADRFADRARASEALTAEGVDGALLLRHINRTKLTLEQRSAIDAILADYTFLDPDEVRHDASDRSFLIDCLFCSDPAARRAAAARLAVITGQAVEFDANASEEIRDAQSQALREKLLTPVQPTTQPAADFPLTR